MPGATAFEYGRDEHKEVNREKDIVDIGMEAPKDRSTSHDDDLCTVHTTSITNGDQLVVWA